METSEIELFSIQISQEALEDLKIINKSGTPAVKKKIERIIQELQIAPEKGVGAPELLKGKEGQVWSRTLNKKDRIVYEVIEDEKMVIISQFLGHYEDK
ncbi:Txe/YoeB family addiction module toxin [Capnocytophaga gingivalis]|jgi:addiction module toxin, txe/yoeB family|uniref:Txe/YoeB family addiction module toxin n=1 Tax=Capnocytophaga gingivalis TaxID=1017 RepID=UPI002B49713A|nr:Txe/YoeB family addiction module toxin [Capnocytophaga gingivalis]MEB3014018.1 Txe/YoeB family addiction module toxin [Capnocytophaga gingivalis]